MLILLIVLLLVFGFGGFRVGPGVGYYGGGGISTDPAYPHHSAPHARHIKRTTQPCIEPVSNDRDESRRWT
jgi:hypothetical protein